MEVRGKGGGREEEGKGREGGRGFEMQFLDAFF